jgi:hypothetical protein
MKCFIIKLNELPIFHVFGSNAFYHVPKKLRRKLDKTGHKCIFLGFDNTSTIVLSIPDLIIQTFRTVVVEDGIFLDQESLKNFGIGHRAEHSEEIAEKQKSSNEIEEDNANFQDNDDWHPNFGKRFHSENNDSDWEEEENEEEDFNLLGMIDEDKGIIEKVLEEINEQLSFLSIDQEFVSQKNTDQKFIHQQKTEKEPIQTKNSMNSNEIHEANEFEMANIKRLNDVQTEKMQKEPKSFEEAIQNPEWLKSMEKEMHALLENKTWVLTDLPKGKKLVKNKWVYKIKDDGRLKSRLVAKGFTQVFGQDYDETWSPVGRKASLRLLIWYVLQHSWHWKQMDVDTAFLNSELDEEIYMNQPIGFNDKSNRVCRLLKTIYGLKQASRMWYKTLKGFLESKGLKQSEVDPCIYFSDGMIIFVYVDDIIISADSAEKMQNLSQEFQKQFKMKDIGKPKRILGFDLHEIENGNGIHLSGQNMIIELLKQCGMDQSKPVSTPMDHKQFFVPNQKEVFYEKFSELSYESIIGSLLYIANNFRPDISYAVSILSQFTSNPSELHFQGIKRILRYLNGTKDYGLIFRKGSNMNILKGFTDADFGSCYTRKSRTGYIFFTENCTLSWSSKKQQVIALSTCEAEYYALVEGGKEAIHLKKLLWEFKNQKPFDSEDTSDISTVTLFCDNQSTIFISKNSTAEHKVMKHVDIRQKWIQEKIESNEFEIQYVQTNEQIADIFTKALPKEKFEKFRNLCNVSKLDF